MVERTPKTGLAANPGSPLAGDAVGASLFIHLSLSFVTHVTEQNTTFTMLPGGGACKAPTTVPGTWKPLGDVSHSPPLSPGLASLIPMASLHPILFIALPPFFPGSRISPDCFPAL